MTKTLHRKSSHGLYIAGIAFFLLSHLVLIFYDSPSTSSSYNPLELAQDSTAKAKTSRDLSEKGTDQIDVQRVAIVITVHGALDYLASCLDKWKKYTENSHVFLADDCDTAEETRELEKLASSYDNVTIVVAKTEAGSVGYTKAVNAGLQAAHEVGFQYIAQLNSDTLLTPNWLPPLLSVLASNPRAGAVGALSNAATWQSIPEITTASGGWNMNPLLPNVTPEMMAKLAFLLSDNQPVELPILNGFLILYRGQVFQDVGFMDEVLSPRGYGEENDFAFRMRKQNYTLWVTPSTYVFHHKGKSFKKEEYATQIVDTKKNMKERYGQELKDAEIALRGSDGLKKLRLSVQANLVSSIPSLKHDMSALFILNCMSTKKPFMLHGGWISLVQEALGLWRNGCFSRIAVPMGYLEQFNLAFPEAKAAGTFIGFTGKTAEAVAEEFIQNGQVFDFLVATHSSTAVTVKELTQKWPNAIPSYYVQDIETAFNDISAKNAAMESYRDFRNGFIFVKTPWLQDELQKQFNIAAHLIPPTVDTDLFVPGRQTYNGSLQLCAMVRISTPRRNPQETLQILSWAAETLGVNTLAYGSSMEDIIGHLNKTEGQTEINLSLINVLGILDRQKMHEVNQVCEVFLDFSSWQAFGRSGIEAMASGVIPILPKNGGASSYAESGKNSFLIGTSDMAEVKTILKDIVEGRYDLAKMREAALATAAEYSLDSSSRKTYRIFQEFLEEWRQTGGSARHALGQENRRI